MPGLLESLAFQHLMDVEFESDTERAWLAGFIDGEGCIRIRKETRHDRDTAQYSLVVQVTQKDPTVLHELKRMFGGGVSVSHSETGGVSNYFVKAKKAAALLEAVYPYLVVKQDQARIGLAFQSRRLAKSIGPKRIDRTEDDADYWTLRNAKAVT